MSKRVLYGVMWALCSALLLTVGLAAVAALGASIAAGNAAPGMAAKMPSAFAVYATVVLIKGLLPALVLALLLWSIARGFARNGEPSRAALALGLLLAAALGSAAAAGLIMPLSTRSVGIVRYTGTANFLRTCAEMTLPVALAAWLPRALLPRSTRALAVVIAGLALSLAAGGAALVRFTHSAAPTTPGSAPLAAPQTGGPGAETAAPQSPTDAPRTVDPAEIADSPTAGDSPSSQLGWEEIERRHAIAERIKKLIEAGPNATQVSIQGGLLAEGSPVPVYRDGNLAGIELQHVPPDGLYSRLGLRDGDVVESINGVAFDSPDAATALMGALVSSAQIELSIARGNGSVQVAVPRERVIEELRALP